MMGDNNPIMGDIKMRYMLYPVRTLGNLLSFFRNQKRKYRIWNRSSMCFSSCWNNHNTSGSCVFKSSYSGISGGICWMDCMRLHKRSLLSMGLCRIFCARCCAPRVHVWLKTSKTVGLLVSAKFWKNSTSRYTFWPSMTLFCSISSNSDKRVFKIDSCSTFLDKESIIWCFLRTVLSIKKWRRWSKVGSFIYLNMTNFLITNQ